MRFWQAWLAFVALTGNRQLQVSSTCTLTIAPSTQGTQFAIVAPWSAPSGMAPQYKRVTDAQFKALQVETWEDEKASAPKCSRDKLKYGTAKWTGWCAREHYDPDDTSDAQIAMFAKYFADECDPAYNSFRNIFPALAQHRKDLAVQGKAVPEGRPSQNPVVRSLKKVVGRRQQHELHESGQLKARDERQMTPEHYEKAMRVCLTMFCGQTALLLRAMLSLQVAMAARSIDTRRIRTANIAQKNYPLLTPGATSMRGGALGPDPAHAIICNSARDKGAGPDRIVNRSVVRAADVEYLRRKRRDGRDHLRPQPAGATAREDYSRGPPAALA